MEEGIALVVLCSGAVRRQNRVRLRVDIAGVEELEKLISRFPSIRHVRSDIIQGAEPAGQFHMRGVIKPSLAKYNHSILTNVSWLLLFDNRGASAKSPLPMQQGSL